MTARKIAGLRRHPGCSCVRNVNVALPNDSMATRAPRAGAPARSGALRQPVLLEERDDLEVDLVEPHAMEAGRIVQEIAEESSEVRWQRGKIRAVAAVG